MNMCPFINNFHTMSNDVKKYQWATAILAILALVLAISLYQAKNNTEVSQDLETASGTLEDCNANILAWRQANPEGQPRSAEAQEELANILSDCTEGVQ
jgi:hypothetical protein